MTFTHRNARLAAIGQALESVEQAIADPAATPDAVERLTALQQSLQGERDGLVGDRFEVGDEYAEGLTRLLLWQQPEDILPILKDDPEIAASGAEPKLTPEAAAAIVALPRAGATPRAGFLAEAAASAGADAIDEISGAALGRWQRLDRNARVSPFRETGVLLPLRLETLFEQDESGRWTMLLRVTPDEISVRRDRPTLSEVEAGFLTSFWARSGMLPRSSNIPAEWIAAPDGAAAFADLSARVTPQRAAWLVTAFPAVLRDDAFASDIPPERIGRQEGDRLAGLPPELVVTAVTGGGGRFELGSLTPDPPPEEFRIPDLQAFDTWLFSWERAKAVGMGGEFVLPDGVSPETISALYVHGIGAEEPAGLFRSHADAGAMGLIRLGAPTNTVQSAPAADLAADNESWSRIAAMRLAGEQGSGIDTLSMALSGVGNALPLLPGASRDVEDDGHIMQVLWPALWGHWFRDIWQGGDEALTFWLWSLDFFHTEGPILPLRIGSQPYGVLPVTALDSWVSAGVEDFDRIEKKLVAALTRLLPAWADAAESRGTIVGGDTGALLDRLGSTGVSSHYVYRSFLDAERLAAAYPPGLGPDFLDRANTLWKPAAAAIRHEPARTYLATGVPHALRLPLVGSNRLLQPELTLRDMLRQLYEIEADNFAAVFNERVLQSIVPQSLLVRLMIQSVLLAKAWFMQSVTGDPNPLLNLTQWNEPPDIAPIEQMQMHFRDSHRDGLGGEPIRKLLDIHQGACFSLAAELDQYLSRERDPLTPDRPVNALRAPPQRQAELERAVGAALDCAGHRIDPLATGIAWRRLRQHVASGQGRHRLGAYGWLDGPFLGTPGPTRSGRLHAPSHAQALTSVILRDKQLSSEAELTPGGRNIWQMDLSSRTVRLAVEMAEEVRMGFHIFEVVGRRVEGIVGRPDRVQALRKARPLRPAAPQARDCCQGLEALDGLLTGAIPDILSDDAGRREEQLAGLGALKASLEAYADLIVAEGVFQVVSGQPARAADAGDAGAGLGRPPPLDFVRTPSSGYRLGTSVLAVLPFRQQDEAQFPIELADASLAAFLDARFGDATAWTWIAEWQETGEDHSESVTLADLGIAPLEAAFMSEDFVAQIVRSRVGAAGARIVPPTQHALMRQLAGSFGGVPATFSDISKSPNPADADERQSVEKVRSDLAARYKELSLKLTQFVEEANLLLDDAERKAWLRRALPWGVTGVAAANTPSPLADILFGEFVVDPDAPEPLPTEAEVLKQLVMEAAKALNERLDRVSKETDPASAASPFPQVARAIGDLVTPGGRVSLTARWPTGALRGASGLRDEAPEAALETDWLPPVAAVRPALARLEAVQLRASLLAHTTPLTAWTSSENFWRADIVKANIEARAAGNLTKPDLSRFVAAFGPADAWAGGDVAVSLIDQFTEAVPMAQRTSHVAFGFNAPASRPPQAILLAVPPRSEGGLDATSILDILVEAHRLLRVRAARPEDVSGHPAAPSMWFDAASSLRVRLDAGTQYYR